VPRKPQPITDVDDPRYQKALSHPLRVRILALLDDGPSSPVQLAGKLDAPLGTIAYHVRQLSDLGLLKLVDTHQRRGATEHVYQAQRRPRLRDKAWDTLAPNERIRVAAAELRQAGDSATAALAAGGFDRKGAQVAHLDLHLDDRGWTELAQATKAWLKEAEKIERAARKRLAQQGAGPALESGLVALLFEGQPRARS
jgi:DNA-binding transcriptional ArsR family regulator